MSFHKAEIIQFLTYEIMAYLLSCVLCEEDVEMPHPL